ncbi:MULTISPECIES: twin transmembrane helix small protein [unclassified Roseitalea]|uniref:twin transmembrane helix small protein n=1 Tax=unclassified Roseitalea TaxID=2639107 RepID=UPI00273D3641|nr:MULTISPECIES: twin transmembrane helix small protein [unclassified Roseitalea]
MSGALFYVAIAVMVAVAVVLLAGLRNMMRQGDANFSNKMMQLRVLLQFIAVVVIVLVVYLARQGS